VDISDGQTGAGAHAGIAWSHSQTTQSGMKKQFHLFVFGDDYFFFFGVTKLWLIAALIQCSIDFYVFLFIFGRLRDHSPHRPLDTNSKARRSLLSTNAANKTFKKKKLDFRYFFFYRNRIVVEVVVLLIFD
jgi:hypothetical protein